MNFNSKIKLIIGGDLLIIILYPLILIILVYCWRKDQQYLLADIKKTNTNYLTSNALNDIFKYHLKGMNDEYFKKNNEISDEMKKKKMKIIKITLK